jgi:hypothetical protein
MSLLRFAFGLLLAVIALAPIGLGAGSLRRRLVPGWRGLDALLAEVVLALTLVLVTAQALGTAGWFRTAPTVVGLAAVGLATWRLGAPTLPPTPRCAPDLPPVPRVHAVVTAVVVATVAGAWLARTHRALERGMETVDTLWYHLPVAARFVQTGDTSAVHYVDADAVTAFFPASAPVLHGLGMLLLGSDVASTALNAWWLALGLGAAWSLGRRVGVAPATTTGAALLFVTPGMVATQPGGGYTDVVGLALLLVAGALLVHPSQGPRPVGQDLLVALAAGLSIGTKFTFVGPAAVLCLLLVVTAAGPGRLRRLAVVLGGVAVAGGYWYGRNLLVAGNPIPTLEVALGPFSLSSLPSATPPATVARLLLDASAWRDWFVPGLRTSLGPAWPVIALAVLGGTVLGVVRRSATGLRLLAVVGGLSLVLFVVTPQYLLIGGEPYFFVFNLRYATPALVLGLVALPLALPRAGAWLLGTYAAAAAVTALDPTAWPWPFGWAVIQDRAAGRDAWWGVLGAGAVLAGWWLLAQGPRRAAATARGAAAVMAITTAAVLAAALPGYRDGRYDETPPFPETFAWARSLESSRIVVTGLLTQVQYPLFGDDRTNHVQYAGIVQDDAGFRPATSCAEWAALLRAGRYDHVLVTPGTVTTTPPQEAEWTERLDGRLVHEEVPVLEGDLLSGPIIVRVYELDPHADPAPACS